MSLRWARPPWRSATHRSVFFRPSNFISHRWFYYQTKNSQASESGVGLAVRLRPSRGHVAARAMLPRHERLLERSCPCHMLHSSLHAARCGGPVRPEIILSRTRKSRDELVRKVRATGDAVWVCRESPVAHYSCTENRLRVHTCPSERAERCVAKSLSLRYKMARADDE